MPMKSQTFEQSLGRLEEVVQRLERGDLPLEEALASFEEGMRLSRLCQKRLDEAEQKIEELTGPAPA
ncbi:MAG: exodeoxyribonuclease VII small subunit [Magnetococcales bacterium]|nr:exodeoxyribonuclease VII small subunit [Magnetococcales bacterium]